MGGAMIGNTLASAGDSLPALKDNILNNVVSQKPDTPINPDLGGGGTQVPDTPINPDLGGGGTQVPDTPINPDLGGGGTQVPVQPNLSGKEDILVTETESVFAPVTSAVSALGATGATMAYNGIVQPAVSTLNSLPPLPVIASLGNSTATSPIMTGMAALDDKDFLIDEEIANIKKLKDHFFNILSKKDKQSPIVLIYEVEEKYGDFDLGEIIKNQKGSVGYYIYTDNGPIMPDHLEHFYYMEYDEDGIIYKVYDSCSPGG